MTKKEKAAATLVPSPESVAKAVKEVEAVAVAMSAFLVSLTKKQRKHTPKARKGADAIVDFVYSLATKYGFESPGLAAEVMKHNRELATVLGPLAIATDTLRGAVLDTILHAKGNAWAAATTYYSALSRAARSNGELETDLKRAKRFFKRRKAKPPSAPKDGASAASRTRATSPDGNGSTSRVS